MADDKKEESPAKPSLFAHPDPFVEIVWTILTILVILYLLNGFVAFFTSSTPYFSGGVAFSLKTYLVNLFWKIFAYLKYIMLVVSIGLAIWIVDLYKKVVALRKAEAALLYTAVAPKEVKNPTWERILKNSQSPNENDWRLAIIEADIMLGDILEKVGLMGETIGDKLKVVEKGDFKTVDNAWEAHKIRNQIAHEGGGFIINQHETKRVIELYQTVFEEFKII